MWRLAPLQLREIKHFDRSTSSANRPRRHCCFKQLRWSPQVLSLRVPRCPLSIERACSELVQALCFRFSRGRGARVSTGHFTDIRIMRCLVKTCLLAPQAQTRHRRKRQRVLAHTWRIKQVPRIIPYRLCFSFFVAARRIRCCFFLPWACEIPIEYHHGCSPGHPSPSCVGLRKDLIQSEVTVKTVSGVKRHMSTAFCRAERIYSDC